MNKTRAGLVQQAFLAALDVPAERREDWLASKYGHDQTLLAEVRSLLAYAEPSVDILEQELDQAVADMPQLQSGYESQENPEVEPPDDISGEEFLFRLSEVGVLSPEEISSATDSINSTNRAAEPRQLASQLVAEGKLTPYQASALLKGEPDLLIDKYLILDLIDVGGMGMVFKAIHRTMNRVVALKMISHQSLASIEQIKRFRREVQVAATLEHPNIVRAYDADEARGLHFLVMEYVRGENLNRVVRANGPLSLSEAVDYIRQTAIALDYAHNRGVVHRDIKPGNLLLDDHGTVKVLDLGLAHLEDSLEYTDTSSSRSENEEPVPEVDRSELTAAGSILGTASFMAPEQSLDAHLVDRRSDIYSLGCTLYYLLTGDTPFSGSTIFKVFVEHREAAIPSLQSKRADVPDTLEAVYRKMMAKQPADRFQSIQEMLIALEACRIAAPRQVESRKTNTSDSNMVGSTSDNRRSWMIGSLVGMAAVLGISIILFNAMKDTPTGEKVDTDSLQSDASPDPIRLAATPVAENLGDAINSSSFELSGDMTEDGLLLVFCSTREGTVPGDRDLWISLRASTEEDWTSVERLPPEINSEESEQMPEISADGLRLRFRRGATWMISNRSDRQAPWNEAIPDPDAIGLRRHYKLTHDGLTAFRSGKLERDERGTQGVRLMTWKRQTLEDPFDEMQEYFIPTPKGVHNFGSLSDDGLLFLFARGSDSENGGSRIFLTTRPDNTSDWAPPRRLFPESEAAYDIPQLLHDGKSFLFQSNRSAGYGASDLWMGQLP